MASQLKRRRALTALVAAPALACALWGPFAIAPRVALAAEAGGLELAEAPSAGVLTIGEDIFSVEESAAAEAPAANPVDAREDAASAAPAAGVLAAPAASSAGSPAGSGEPCREGVTSSIECYQQDSTDDSITSEHQNGNQALAVADSREATAAARRAQAPSLSVSASVADPQPSGSITFYETHPAEIVFSATEGGSISAGRAGSDGTALATSSTSFAASALTAAAPSSTRLLARSLTCANTFAADADPLLGTQACTPVTETYADSLSGVSRGATAVADAGFHFLWWLDEDTGDVLSTSAYFVPDRPEEGWPAAWHIIAVFEEDAYLIILDPNGGSAGGGGGDSGLVPKDAGTITLRARPGEAPVLPLNGDGIELTRFASAFVGWDVVADPSATDSEHHLFIEDGAALDSTVESWLERAGILRLEWTGGTLPTLTLYAQWLDGQVAITYEAGQGGVLSVPANVKAKSATLATETLDAETGAHATDASTVGPQGARAVSKARHHFSGWSATGGARLAAADAASATLTGEAVAAATLYASDAASDPTYHEATFTASFAPNSYVLSYASNGGTGAVGSTSVTYGSSAALASAGVSREGYTLSGWNLAAAGTGASYALGSSVGTSTLDTLIGAGILADADGAGVTLYAQWARDPEPATTTDASQAGENGAGASDYASDGFGSTSAPAEPEFALSLAETLSSAADAASVVADTADALAEAAQEAAEVVAELAAAIVDPERDLSELAPVELAAIASAAASASAGESSEGGAIASYFSEMTPAEAVEATGTAVAAVAAVGALAGLVGVGASIAGATAAGAAAIGTATTIGLTSVADMAADLAAEGAAEGAGSSGAPAAMRGVRRMRRRREAGDVEAEG